MKLENGSLFYLLLVTLFPAQPLYLLRGKPVLKWKIIYKGCTQYAVCGGQQCTIAVTPEGGKSMQSTTSCGNCPVNPRNPITYETMGERYRVLRNVIYCLLKQKFPHINFSFLRGLNQDYRIKRDKFDEFAMFPI